MDTDLLYITDTDNGKIQIVDVDGNCSGSNELADDVCFVDEFGQVGNEEGEFDSPSALTIDTVNELLYIADSGNDRIQIVDTDGICANGVCIVDEDGDGVPDNVDNCPSIANPGQIDSDTDSIGDVCDEFPFDKDNDGIDDTDDNCPTTSNGDQTDSDSDGLGDVCDVQNEPVFQQILQQIQNILASILGLDNRVTELENQVAELEDKVEQLESRPGPPDHIGKP
jgi:DNA-binding beta-propeller fold protein YncE